MQEDASLCWPLPHHELLGDTAGHVAGVFAQQGQTVPQRGPWKGERVGEDLLSSPTFLPSHWPKSVET